METFLRFRCRSHHDVKRLAVTKIGSGLHTDLAAGDADIHGDGGRQTLQACAHGLLPEPPPAEP
jgi:hypothetical protein